MNQSQYTPLLDVLAMIPDPRKTRGRRYACPLLLTLTAGLSSGHQTILAIAQWIHLHANRLRAALPNRTTLPSKSTLRLIIRQIAVGLQEAVVAQLNQPHPATGSIAGQMMPPCGPILPAQSVDGKTLIGVPVTLT